MGNTVSQVTQELHQIHRNLESLYITFEFKKKSDLERIQDRLQQLTPLLCSVDVKQTQEAQEILNEIKDLLKKFSAMTFLYQKILKDNVQQANEKEDVFTSYIETIHMDA